MKSSRVPLPFDVDAQDMPTIDRRVERLRSTRDIERQQIARFDHHIRRQTAIRAERIGETGDLVAENLFQELLVLDDLDNSCSSYESVLRFSWLTVCPHTSPARSSVRISAGSQLRIVRQRENAFESVPLQQLEEEPVG